MYASFFTGEADTWGCSPELSMFTASMPSSETGTTGSAQLSLSASFEHPAIAIIIATGKSIFLMLNIFICGAKIVLNLKPALKIKQQAFVENMQHVITTRGIQHHHCCRRSLKQPGL
jgi:DNA-directed RNA polymerase subunit N (RpoN/RPB10)